MTPRLRLRIRPLTALLVLWLLTLGLNATLTALFPISLSVHDEFAHRLAADTFRGGELSLPTPKGHEHLESPHVNLQPTRHSAYMPGHAMVLSIGWKLFGSPIGGAWLLGAFLAAAVAWALLAVMPLRWALCGGAVAAVHPGIVVYWNQTLFGGTLAACGGALVCGSVLRIMEKPRLTDGICFALGLFAIVMTRPYMGALILLSSGLFLARTWILAMKDRRQALLRCVLIPVLCTGLAGVGFLLHYNKTLTGDPLQLPYSLNASMRGAVPNFVFLSKPAPAEGPDSLQMYQRFRSQDYRAKRTVSGFVKLTLGWMGRLIRFYLASGVLLLPLLGLRWAWRLRLVRQSIWVLGITGLAMMPIKTVNPQYAAPLVVIFCLVTVVAARELIVRRFGKPLLIVGAMALLASPFAVSAERRFRLEDAWFHRRAAIQEQLESSDGGHVVFVVYDETHDPLSEWVHNEADIRHAKVIWARSLGAVKDHAFTRAYPDRTAWFIRADDPSAELQR